MDEEEVFEYRRNCANKAVRHKVKYEDCDDDTGPPMNIENNIDKEMDYKFHNNAPFLLN